MSLRIKEPKLLLLLKEIARESDSEIIRIRAKKILQVFKYYEFLKSLTKWTVISEARKLGLNPFSDSRKWRIIASIIHHKFGTAMVDLIIIVYGEDPC
jgi:hypothetical protein